MRFWGILFLFLLFPLYGCSDQGTHLQEGYYAAEMEAFDHQGWKAFVTIYVANGKIITVEYDAKNEAGFLKSWDMDYIRWMKATQKTYPNRYMRAYSTALINWQDPEKVYPLAGTEYHCDLFKLLAKAAMDKSYVGDKNIASVAYPLPTASS